MSSTIAPKQNSSHEGLNLVSDYSLTWECFRSEARPGLSFNRMKDQKRNGAGEIISYSRQLLPTHLYILY
jgi:hypothetical protein